MSADKDYDALAATLHAHAEPMKNDTTEDGENKAAESPASLLVDFMRARCRLVHDEYGDAYAIERATGEVRNIERGAFKT